jgi:hypothetical protein
VIDWNRALLSIVRTPGVQPATIHSTRSFAILHAAIYDAVNAIGRAYKPYLIAVPVRGDASERAAADAAAHTVLVALYPAEQRALDADCAAELAQVPDSPARDEGVRVGVEVARELLRARAADGSAVMPPPLITGSDPGDYRATPPEFRAPILTTWGHVTPFVIERGDSFRPAPPPPLTSDAYAAAINEVKCVGSATSATRTAEQTEDANFWSAPIQNYWNEIAEKVAIAHHSNLPETARLFAALNLALADSAIATFDAKYTFQFWRPITAILLADTVGNPEIEVDPGWTPLATTPADPSYPSAHSALSAAAADVLVSFFGDDQQFPVTSEVLPGVTHAFTSFRATAKEAGLSRIYAGVHMRLDHEAGQKLGDDVADFVLHHALLRYPDAQDTQQGGLSLD